MIPEQSVIAGRELPVGQRVGGRRAADFHRADEAHQVLAREHQPAVEVASDSTTNWSNRARG
jgi:hypothetical protein